MCLYGTRPLILAGVIFLRSPPPAQAVSRAYDAAIVPRCPLPSGPSYPLHCIQGGYFQGHGIRQWADGDLYDGDWHQDLKEGQGAYTYMSGDVYEGQWHKDQRDGFGRIQMSNGDTYDGEWRCCFVRGRPAWSPPHLRPFAPSIPRVLGTVPVPTLPVPVRRKDKFEGQGRYLWTDGSLYEGSLRDGMAAPPPPHVLLPVPLGIC